MGPEERRDDAGRVRELRVALTVDDFDAALAFYRDALGLAQVADWSSPDGRVVVLAAGRATLELLDERQAEYVDEIEVGTRVAGHVRVALEVDDSAARADVLERPGPSGSADMSSRRGRTETSGSARPTGCS
jgi:lactoylglutathione lyase